MSGWPQRVTWVTRLREWWQWRRRDQRWVEEQVREFRRRNNFTCPHDDYLCDKYGCPDDPNRTGDRK